MPRTVQFLLCAAVAVCGQVRGAEPEGVVRSKPEGRVRATPEGRVRAFSTPSNASDFGVWQTASVPEAEGVIRLRRDVADAIAPGSVRVTKAAAETQPAPAPTLEDPAQLGVWTAQAPKSRTAPPHPLAESPAAAAPKFAASVKPSAVGVASSEPKPPVAPAPAVEKAPAIAASNPAADQGVVRVSSKAPQTPAATAQMQAALVILSQAQPVDPPTAIDIQTPTTQAEIPSLEPVPPTSDAPQTPEQLMKARLRMLNRPLNSIALVDPPQADHKEPENIAREVQGELPAIGVWGSPWSVPAPQRYTYAFTHNPLYYQDVNLERCGVGHGEWQPIVSSLDFLGRTIILPYMMVTRCPGDCETTLGDCPTCHQYPCGCGIPHGTTDAQTNAVVVEAAVIGGIVVLLML